MSIDRAFEQAFGGWQESRPQAVAREGAGGPSGVLRVVDDRSGRLGGIRSDRRVPLRLCVHLRCDGGRIGLTDLRAALVGDVLQRTAEVVGLQVVPVLVVPELGSEQAKVLDRAAAALGIHPAVATVGLAQARGALGGPAHAHVVAQGADAGAAPDGEADGEADGVWIAVGHAEGEEGVGELDGGAAQGLASGAVDATTVRLALLARPHGEPARADAGALGEAALALAAWRRQVAGWAQSPSGPVPDELRREADAAFATDLDTPAALALLRRVERTGSLAEGVRFETFVLVDRVLGLELARDIALVGQRRE
ncbi:hypothetical protein [Kitasatospora mediocidica]|uniref:hypothetical protein n=1 Tax=Kitasatospora mediocidica TaxID=58352 RepID=UPI000A65E048|nr:hypothetical protein [Kitasatospora mediocidica]